MRSEVLLCWMLNVRPACVQYVRCLRAVRASTYDAVVLEV